MNAMVIGADSLGGIPQLLSAYGISIFRHISGRNAAHQRKLSTLPKDIDMLILFTDFVGHNVMRHFRGLANEHNIPMLACRRSSCALMQSLDQCGMTHKTCQNCTKRQKP